MKVFFIFINGYPTRYNTLFYPNCLDHFRILGGSIAQTIKNALKSNILALFRRTSTSTVQNMGIDHVVISDSVPVSVSFRPITRASLVVRWITQYTSMLPLERVSHIHVLRQLPIFIQILISPFGFYNKGVCQTSNVDFDFIKNFKK